MSKTEKRNTPIWQRAKFVYALVVAILVFTALVVLASLGKLTVSAQQIVDFGTWLAGLLIGGHAITDVASLASSRSKK